MKLSWSRYRLALAQTFTIAHGSSDYRETLFVRFEHDGEIGFGHAAPNPRYGETPDTAEQALDAMSKRLVGDPMCFRPFIHHAISDTPGNYAAKAALDMAVLDWVGKRMGAPLYRILGLDPSAMQPTSMTIGIDTPEVVKARAAELLEYKALKIKLGSENDRGMIEAIREVSDQPIRVDANEGWTHREHALREIEWLADHHIDLVEQPMPAAQQEDMVWLKERSPLPLIADEAFTSPNEIPTLKDQYHGINIKLMKVGGLLAALDAATVARTFGMSMMLGCMVESALGVAAAAQMAPLVDYVDLDGNILIKNDTFEAHPVVDGCLALIDRPGLGISPLANYGNEMLSF